MQKRSTTRTSGSVPQVGSRYSAYDKLRFIGVLRLHDDRLEEGGAVISNLIIHDQVDCCQTLPDARADPNPARRCSAVLVELLPRLRRHRDRSDLDRSAVAATEWPSGAGSFTALWHG
jgi:hypothetical protein